MSIHDRFAKALTRISTTTSVARTRQEDVVRASRDGDLDKRHEVVVSRFEKLADELEKALA